MERKINTKTLVIIFLLWNWKRVDLAVIYLTTLAYNYNSLGKQLKHSYWVIKHLNSKENHL